MGQNVLTVTYPNLDTRGLQSDCPAIAQVTTQLRKYTAFFTNVTVTPNAACDALFSIFSSLTIAGVSSLDGSQVPTMVNLITLTLQQVGFGVSDAPSISYVPVQVAQAMNTQVTQENKNIQQVYQNTSPLAAQGNVLKAVGMGLQETANVIVGNPYDQGIAGGENPDNPPAFDWTTVAILAGIGVAVFLVIKFVD